MQLLSVVANEQHECCIVVGQRSWTLSNLFGLYLGIEAGTEQRIRLLLTMMSRHVPGQSTDTHIQAAYLVR